MRIFQIRENLIYGDASGNILIIMDKLLSKHYDSYIAVNVHSDEYESYPRVICFKRLEDLDLQEDDIVIYHFGGFTTIGLELMRVACKRIILYQNVTYPFFYAGINENILEYCLKGQQYIRSVVGGFLRAIAPSSFSRDELMGMKWKPENVYLLPLPVSLERRNLKSKGEKKERFFLFVGRIAPNKKVEDVIIIFDYYRKKYYKESYLRLVGLYYQDAYYDALNRYIDEKRIENVEFLNHVTDEELDELYRTSDIYLCMSEHEGFCMPLIEAMNYEIPVVAYNATAVPDTVGDAGVLLDSKDPKYVCEKIDKIFEDEEYRKKLIEGQNRHIDTYIRDDYEKKLFDIIEEVKSISSYSYDESGIEFYKILLEEIEKSGNEYLQEQLRRLRDIDKPIVLYGAGKVGAMLLEYFANNDLSIEAVCDAGKCGEEVEGKTILSPQDCTEQYLDAIYIITVQKPNIASEISDNLFELGISRSNILRYSNSDKMIVV